MHSFKQEELLLYMYGDTSNDQTAAIKQALETDWELNEEYKKLVASQSCLGQISFSPRKEAIDFILDYAARPIQELSGQER